jgi:transcriptional regulator with XRE-family HTH domain
VASQAAMPTLGQLLQQARELQGLSLRQAAARLKHKNGRPITPKYLHLLEQDDRRPSLHLVLQLATALALDVVLLVAYAHQADALLRQYLEAHPTSELELVAMLWQAEHRGFVDWARVTRLIVAPDTLRLHRGQPPTPRTRVRRSPHAQLSQPACERLDH